MIARNSGLKKTKGKYIINLDADCRAPKNWLARYEYLFLQNKKIAFITGPYVCSGSKKDYLNIAIAYILKSYYRLFKTSFAYYGGNFAFKKSVFLKIGGYDLRFPTDQLSLIKRFKNAGGKIVFDKKLCVQSSPRRTKKRLLKFFFKEVLLLYFFNNFYIKLTGKSLGSWDNVGK